MLTYHFYLERNAIKKDKMIRVMSNMHAPNQSSDIDFWSALPNNSAPLTLSSFLTILENLSDGFCVNRWIRDKAGHAIDYVLIALNSRFEKLIERTRSELLHKLSVEVFGADASSLMEKFLELEHGVSSVNFEYSSETRQKDFTITAFSLDQDTFAVLLRDQTTHKKAAKALDRGIQIFQKFMQTVQDGIIIVDLHGRIQLWNEAAERIFGYTKDEALGKVVDHLIIPEERQRWVDERWYALIKSAIAGGEGIKLEFECRTKNGGLIPIDVSLSLTTIDNEWMGIAVVRDISERKMAEKAVERREAILTAVSFAAERLLQADAWQDSIQDILAILGVATEVDRVYLFKKDESQSEDDVYVSQLYEWVAADVIPQIDNPALQHMPLRENGFGRWLDQLSQNEALYGSISEFPLSEQDFLRAQGIQSLVVVPVFVIDHWWGFVGFDDCHTTRTWSRSEIDALRLAANLIGTAIHRQEISAQIHQSEKRYRNLVERLPVVVYVAKMTPQGALQAEYISPNVLDLCGYTPQEIHHDPSLWTQRIHPADQAQAISTYHRHLSERTAWDQEYRFICKNGETIWLREQALPIFDPQSNTLRAQGVIQDISLQKRRQREQQATQLVHQALQGDDTLDTMLSRLLEAVIHAIPNAEKGSILVSEGDGLTIRALYGYQDERIWKVSFPLTSGYSAKTFRLREPLIIPDAHYDPSIRYEGEIEEMVQVQSAITAPLLLHDQAIGVISLDNCTRKNAFSLEDLHFLSQIAATAALVVENVRLLDEARNRLRELELISSLSYAMRDAKSHSEMVDITLERILNSLQMDCAAIRLYDHTTKHILYENMRGYWQQIDQFLNVFGNERIRILREKQSSISIEKDANCQDSSSCPCRFLAGVALVNQTHSIGELLVCRRSKISEQDFRILEAIADIVANALHRASLHEKTEKQLRHLSSLYTIDRAISKRHDLRAVLQIIAQEARPQLGVDAIALHIFDPQTKQLSFIAGDGFYTDYIKDTHLRMGEGEISKSALQKTPIYVPNVYRVNTPLAKTKLCIEEGFIAHHTAPLLIQDQLKGAIEVFHRAEFNPSEDWRALFEAFADQAAIAIDNAQLFEDIQRTNLELSIAYDATLEGWAKALEQRDRETLGHTNRVTELTLHMAAEMGIPNEQLIHIWRGARLHDIGKMAIPDQILLKSGPLTEEEWEVMRLHPVYAYELLSPIEYLRPALDIPYCHHEHWDGSGYPRGLKGEEIPLAARIFAVVDVWDALTSGRPYRSAWDAEEAIQYILNQRGKQFDPSVVDVFLRIIKERIENNQ